jgi:hypothetical protein
MKDFWKDDLHFVINEPLKKRKPSITQEDVWGTWDDERNKRTSKGMIVASEMKGYPDRCPIWKDKVPHKSVTVVCKKEQVPDVVYWLEFVHGGDSVTRMKDLPKGKVALRSDYQCW